MIPVVESLLASGDPTLEYRTRVEVLGEDPAGLTALRGSIADSPRARALLSSREADDTIRLNPYTKWQGPHWTLVQLALIAYPPGDESLVPLRDQFYGYLDDPRHLKPPRSLLDDPVRPRRCGSQEGNAVWYSMELGLVDERTQHFVDRLIDMAWPDGGWNCDKQPGARSSSFMETLIPLRALHRWSEATGDRRAAQAADRAAEFLLEHRLLWRRRDGEPADERFLRIHHPIRFYDVLGALAAMAEMGRIGDPRCRDALDLLEEKRTADGGLPAEVRTARTSPTRVTRGTYADWGRGGRTRSNPFVTIEALAVLRAAGRSVG